MTDQSPMTRYLGDVDRRTGPFGLLGLPVGPVTPADVERALQLRLDRVNRHAHARSPEADEVRLALHVAAAQLRDPQVRSELLQRYTNPGSASAPSSDPVFEDVALRVLVHSGGWNARAKRRLAAMAHVHGLDEAALEGTLRSLATRNRSAPHARGSSPGRSSAARPTDAVARQGRRKRSYVAAIPAVAQRWILGALMILLVISTILMAIRVAGLWRSHAGVDDVARQPEIVPDDIGTEFDPTQAAPRDPIQDPADPTATESPDEPAEVQPEPMRTPEEIAAAIHEAIRVVPDDPESAIVLFRAAVEDVSESWSTLDESMMLALHGDIVHLTHAVAARLPDGTGRIVDLMAAGDGAFNEADRWPDPIALRRAVWTSGMLNRLRRQRSLPWRLVEGLEDRLEAHYPFGQAPGEDGFSPGAGAALDLLGARIIPQSAARLDAEQVGATWEAWVECALALPGTDEDDAQARFLSMIEATLVTGADPALHQPTRRVLLLLLPQVDWSRADLAGLTLLRWFDRSDISLTDLVEVTSWLSRETAVDADMVVAVDLDPDERFALRNRYADLYGLKAISRDEDTTDLWVREARDLLEPADATVSPSDLLRRTVGMAFLNLAANHIYRHEDALAMDAMAKAGEDPSASASGSSGLTSPITADVLTAPGVRPDGEWALQYLTGARGSASRRALLNQFPSETDRIGPADADTLAGAACFGGSNETRVHAQRIVVRHATSPAIVNALLEVAPRMPRQPRVSAMIEDVTGRPLPSEDDPEWRVAVRRSLVEALLELLAGDARIGLDDAAAALGQAYQGRNIFFALALPGEQASPSSEVEIADSPQDGMSMLGRAVDLTGGPVSPATVADQLCSLWTERADDFIEGDWAPYPLTEIVRRREGRARFARGPVQEFAAAQVSLAEVMAYVVAANRPSQASDIRSLMKTLASERRPDDTEVAKQHIFRQLYVTERTILKLWLILLGAPVEVEA